MSDSLGTCYVDKKEVIELTVGRYGHEQFKEFFE
jgi:hypothetical protein